jgi:hypothetical protein
VQFETDWVGDVRTVASTGPFDIPDGQSILVSGAIMLGTVPDGTTELWVDPDNSFRPDPDDPILADLLNTKQNIHNFYDQNLRGIILPKAGQGNSESEMSKLPTQYVLYPAFPNPFNPSTKIKFDLPEPEIVKIQVYNLVGQNIETLINKPLPAGQHEVEFNGQNLSSGVYLYWIRAGEFQDVNKMILLR